MQMNVTQQLIKAMAESGVTRYRIAADSGVSAGQLSRLVHGMQELSATNLEKVAHAIGYSVALVPGQKRQPTKATRTTRKQTTTKGT
jgi:transcriptional regulator with XRE-family HTH domain